MEIIELFNLIMGNKELFQNTGSPVFDITQGEDVDYAGDGDNTIPAITIPSKRVRDFTAKELARLTNWFPNSEFGWEDDLSCSDYKKAKSLIFIWPRIDEPEPKIMW